MDNFDSSKATLQYGGCHFGAKPLDAFYRGLHESRTIVSLHQIDKHKLSNIFVSCLNFIAGNVIESICFFFSKKEIELTTYVIGMVYSATVWTPGSREMLVL